MASGSPTSATLPNPRVNSLLCSASPSVGHRVLTAPPATTLVCLFSPPLGLLFSLSAASPSSKVEAPQGPSLDLFSSPSTPLAA